jgi:hypothetical protein
MLYTLPGCMKAYIGIQHKVKIHPCPGALCGLCGVFCGLLRRIFQRQPGGLPGIDAAV